MCMYTSANRDLAIKTIATGCAARKRRLYYRCTMPNLNPAPDSLEHLAIQLELIRQRHYQRVAYGCITKGQKGEGDLVDFEALADHVVAFSDERRGVQSESLMRQAMERSS